MTKLGVAYFGNRFLSHARRDLDRMARSCDYVVHTVNETDLAFHKAALTRLFEETRRRNLEIWVDPWGLGGVFGGEALSTFLMEHRDSWQVMSDGRAVPNACLNRPEWRAYMKEWILTVRDMGGQVLFWDEPHVAFTLDDEADGVYACTCDECRKLFKKRFGGDMPKRLTDEARIFRRETIKAFLDEVMAYAHGKNLKNAICLYAYKGIAEYDLLWKGAAALEHLDIMGCDPYWRWRGRTFDPSARVAEFSKYVVESAAPYGKGSQVWVQAMRLPKGTEPEVGAAIRAAVAEKVTHVAAWSFDGGELLDPVLSENPEAVWQAVEDTYMALRAAR